MVEPADGSKPVVPPAPLDGVVLTEDQKRKQRRRNIAIALVLVGCVVLFYVMTIIKLGGDVAQRAM
jgi:hypothetical protein